MSSRTIIECDICGQLCDQEGSVALSYGRETDSWYIAMVVGDEMRHICMDCAAEVYKTAVDEEWFQEAEK